MIKARRIAWLLLILSASPAYAHAPVAGIEGFYIGLLHPFSTPSQAALMFGVALAVGGFGVEKARWQLGTFLVASFVGLFVGSAASDLDATMCAVAFAGCALAALFPGKIAPAAIALAAVGGFLIGSSSIPDDGPARDRLFTMSGSIIGANVGLLYLFGVINVIRERFTWAWVGVAFRVAAAWLGAIALLMLALGFVDTPPPA